ncbi:AzlC family ABC transporter permease [Pelagibius litoralis]|uniref:AzlC family ABC transporter permease n=1 Tax=Pelagibius litoralis TaxID=374515 RepID=A0A967C4G5_9PROT|nr:AzlC family ABC transporter permease [Pelagibius litoralis]NIA68205.1 AzlC family ABC transporter permease [Pelagibius litoralis]
MPNSDITGGTLGSGYASPRHAALKGLQHALGVPALVLGASYLGFGSLIHGAGLDVWHGLFSTFTGWALPGQIILVELYSLGASVLIVAAAVAMTNARLLPMTVALMPYLRAPGTPRWRYYLFAHYIAVTGWAAAMRHCPDLPEPQRLPYFAGFAVTLWSMTLVTTAVGFYLADLLPGYITLGLVFLNPIYFMLVFVADARHRARILALAFGAVCGPLLHLVSPDWGLPLTGLLAGSLAFFGDRLWSQRNA